MLRISVRTILAISLISSTTAYCAEESNVVTCRYAGVDYPLGHLIFIDDNSNPFYCANVNGKGVWRNFKGFSTEEADVWLDEDGNTYPFTTFS